MRLAVSMIALVLSGSALAARPAAAAGEEEAAAAAPDAGDARRPISEVRAWIGDRSQFVSMFTAIPAAPSLAVAVDLRAPVRIELQLVAGIFWSVQTTASAGVPFLLYDGRESGRSVLELKLPLQLAFGYVKAEWEADDGYDDEVSWLLLGPTAGLDFTWWVRERLGVCLAIGGSFLFRIADLGSAYGGGDDDPTYSVAHGKLGIGEVILSFGLAFR